MNTFLPQFSRATSARSRGHLDLIYNYFIIDLLGYSVVYAAFAFAAPTYRLTPLNVQELHAEDDEDTLTLRTLQVRATDQREVYRRQDRHYRSRKVSWKAIDSVQVLMLKNASISRLGMSWVLVLGLTKNVPKSINTLFGPLITADFC